MGLYMCCCCAYHDRLAGPPVLLFHDQRVRDDQHRVADEGQGRGQREPFEDALLRLGNVVVDRALDEVARGVRRGQRLASRAGGGGFGDINIRISRGDAAGGEGGEEEDQHDDGIGILQHRNRLAQARGRPPSQVVAGEQRMPGLGEVAGHGRGRLRRRPGEVRRRDEGSLRQRQWTESGRGGSSEGEQDTQTSKTATETALATETSTPRRPGPTPSCMY
jgi:hypothetical protein